MSNAIRFVHTSFCDDVRHEQGGKISLMGIYQGSLVIPSGAPGIIQKLCIVVEAQTPIDDPFTKLTLQLRKDGKVIEEISFPENALGDLARTRDPKRDLKMSMLGSIFILQGMLIEKSCLLSVVALTEREEFLSARLSVEFSGAHPEQLTQPV